ncbi:unnamed protein product [Schistocephalus solidus]|uniref:Uncharacterized protein n=1 Tax=Schistocephalus solidus TaxID=70667 RepID=A0A183SGY8_SCHSO|nr:unnamed protein product [Schistocephalus solidus]
MPAQLFFAGRLADRATELPPSERRAHPDVLPVDWLPPLCVGGGGGGRRRQWHQESRQLACSAAAARAGGTSYRSRDRGGASSRCE